MSAQTCPKCGAELRPEIFNGLPRFTPQDAEVLKNRAEIEERIKNLPKP
jgi:hypothetical protein